jgi:hypothetical protein
VACLCDGPPLTVQRDLQKTSLVVNHEKTIHTPILARRPPAPMPMRRDLPLRQRPSTSFAKGAEDSPLQTAPHVTEELLADARRRAAGMGSHMDQSAAKPPARRAPMWLVLLILIGVVVRGAFMLSKLSPTYVAERVAEAKQRQSPDRPLQGPRGIMHPVRHAVDAATTQSSTAAAGAASPTPQPMPDFGAGTPRREGGGTQTGGATAFEQLPPTRVNIVEEPTTSKPQESTVVATMAGTRDSAVRKRSTKWRARNHEKASGALKKAEEEHADATRALTHERTLLEAARAAIEGAVATSRAEATGVVETTATATASAVRSAKDRVATAEAEAVAADALRWHEQARLNDAERRLNGARRRARGGAVKESGDGSDATVSVADERVLEEEVRVAHRAVSDARKEAHNAVRMLDDARRAHGGLNREIEKAARELHMRRDRLIEKAEKRGVKELRPYETRVISAERHTKRTASALQKAVAELAALDPAPSTQPNPCAPTA